MEDFTSYSSLKQGLSSIPAKAMSFSSRQIVQNYLDLKQPLKSKNGYCRDYRGLGEQMNIQPTAIKIFEKRESVTEAILDAWEIHLNATFDKLIDFLEEMERYDVIEELIPRLERDAKAYLERQKLLELPIQVPEVSAGPGSSYHGREMKVLTPDDLKTGECTFYDAFVSYADEDYEFVLKLSEVLESPEIGFKLFIPGRDLLAGFTEHDTTALLITERCRRVLIILSPNFLRNPTAAFQASYATGLAIDEQMRKLLPILYVPCKMPLLFKFVSKIDFTRPDVQERELVKLIFSLLPENRVIMMATPPLQRALKSLNAIQTLL